MKIVCIGRNYAAHAAELGNAIPDEPLFFLKPESAILPKGSRFRFPSYSTDIHYEIELILRIGSAGCGLNESNALSIIEAYSIGLDMTARDVQSTLKAKGKPWTKAKAFDGSAIIGSRFLPWDLDAFNASSFQLEQNGKIVQSATPELMLFNVAQIIAHVTDCMTLLPGDIVFTGTPEGVGAVAPGDGLIGRLNGEVLIETLVDAK